MHIGTLWHSAWHMTSRGRSGDQADRRVRIGLAGLWYSCSSNWHCSVWMVRWTSDYRQVCKQYTDQQRWKPGMFTLLLRLDWFVKSTTESWRSVARGLWLSTRVWYDTMFLATLISSHSPLWRPHQTPIKHFSFTQWILVTFEPQKYQISWFSVAWHVSRLSL